MLYYTSATTCFLPKARVLGKTLKKYNPDAKFYLLLSDKLPEDFSLEDEPFDGVLQSDEIELNCDMSVPFWFYLHDVTELCTAVKGWGALKLLELTGEDKIVYLDPDIAVFAKGMTNGYPLSAVIGKKDVMQAAQDTFISSTFWTERIALAAAVKSIDCYEKYKVFEHQIKIGNMVEEGWKEAAGKAGIKISISGIKPLIHFSFVEGEPLVYKTFFTQEMLKRGYLSALAVYTSLAHTEAIVSKYLDACYEVFCEIKKAETTDGGVKGLLRSEACHSGFERLN